MKTMSKKVFQNGAKKAMMSKNAKLKTEQEGSKEFGVIKESDEDLLHVIKK
jgi:hypothetical protein